MWMNNRGIMFDINRGSANTMFVQPKDSERAMM